MIPLVEKKPHGLLLGGFTSLNPIGNEELGVRINSEEPDPMVIGGLAGMGGVGLFGHRNLETYRSYGNHRIATHLRKSGWDVECVDYGIFFTNEELANIFAKRITEDTVFVGFSMLFGTLATEKLNWLTDHIRKNYPRVSIISGGQKTWTVSCVDADYFITGNGEYAMDALLKYLRGGNKPNFHGKLANGGRLITAQHSYPCFPKRDSAISFEDRDFIQPNETVNVEFARGCIFSCKYCSFPLLGMKEDTTRNEDSLYEELLENYEKWGITNYYITDDTVNDSKDKIALLARAVRRLPFQPTFAGYVRADLLIRHGEDTWKDMVDMGFTNHSYGIETFNHQSGKSVGKGMKPEELKKGLLEIQDYFNEHSHTYYAGTFTMIAGLPYETWESLEETKEWVNEHWGGHVVTYLPLYLSEPDDEQADEMDWRVYNNFMEYGYTYSYDIPHIVNPKIRQHVELMKKGKEHNKNRQKNKWNFWVHPSGDYDFADMMEWVDEFTQDRIESGKNPAGVWSTNFVHAEVYKNPKEGKRFYKQDHENLPVNALINIIRKYKQNKLEDVK